MANRWFQQFILCLDKKPVKVFGKLVVGGTGAVTSGTGNGIASIVRSAQGDYLVTLTDAFSAFLSFSAVHLVATGEDLVCQVKAVDPAAKTLSFFTNTHATPTDPASGTVIYFEITYRNSSVER